MVTKVYAEQLRQEVNEEREKLGKKAIEDDDDGELLTVSENHGILDLSWHLYEMLALEIPIRHVHEDGECNEQVLKRLKGEDREKQVDPRWAALEQLKTKINNKE